MEFHDDENKALAHELWENEGRPDGNPAGFWYAAIGSLIEQKRKERSREEAEASTLSSVGTLVVR